MEVVERFFSRAGGTCYKKYAASKGLMPQNLKPLSMFWVVTASAKAFVHYSTNEAGLGAMPLHSLCRSLSKRVQALLYGSENCSV